MMEGVDHLSSDDEEEEGADLDRLWIMITCLANSMIMEDCIVQWGHINHMFLCAKLGIPNAIGGSEQATKL
ncbi:hypothetical protein RchiOBHm_Chr4g0440441 [Rosa chinensis]|uniref:Uncharacterized protein n=1 Tax=Rosa chinensis TaxID=74649 RepID=A0A2P6R326_ROSCH|nr:hypothetical protein RchiOBHm_Chr4g0440441 [Rosa chinensis]